MKSLISLLNEKLNCSFVFVFKLKKIDSQDNIEHAEKFNSENLKVEKNELSLKRSLNHLELINYLENCELEKSSKYFPENFINELKNAKYEARFNAIKASANMITNAA